MGKKKRKKRLKRKIKAIRHFLVFLGAVIIQRFFSLLPYKPAMSLGSWLGRLGFYLLPQQRKRTLNNLSIALGKQKSPTELRRIARAVFANSGRGAVELSRLSRFSPQTLSKSIKVNNPHYLVDTYKNGKGVIGLTAHLGNWELLAAYLSQVLKIKFYVIARPLNNKYLNNLLTRLRHQAQVKVIVSESTRKRQADDTSGFSILRCLRQNIGIGILADQDTRGPGLFVEFLGQYAYTQVGPAKLALRLGTPIVPLFIHRDENGITHTIDMEPPLSFELTNNETENIKGIVQSYTNIIAEYVKKYPTQWMWMHRRWKRRSAEIELVHSDNSPAPLGQNK